MLAVVVPLSFAGFIAGAMNALSGGGSFVTLSALVAAGMPSLGANASSTVALWPGGAASAWVYRDGARPICGVSLRLVLAATVIGSLVGALLLLWTPTSLFDRVLPWLLLVATVVLAAGPRLRVPVRAGATTVLLLQLVLGIYGGYFGGAVGLMMMAAWSLLDGAEAKTLNAPRTLMVSAANTVAVVCFVVAGAVSWRAAIAVAAGALLGGYAGARLGKTLPPRVVRIVTLVIAVALTARFFVKAYS